MQNQDAQATARRHLDRRIANAGFLSALQPPPRGWIKAVREALGMTTAQLAGRLGISQPAVARLEQSEAGGHVKLETLERAAAALGCRLAYALIPNEPLERQVQSRRREIAEEQLAAAEHSMVLENQGVDNQSAEDRETRERLLSVLAAQIGPKALWGDK